MSLGTKRMQIAEVKSARVETANVRNENSTRDGEIRSRAYQIYIGRGEQPGRELDDWLQAECEIDDGVV